MTRHSILQKGQHLLKWSFLIILVAVLAGSASALFLWTLDVVTAYREAHLWLLLGLPFAGLSLGYAYNRWGSAVVRGNNQIISEIQQPDTRLPLAMAPSILMSTLVTHLFGGSAGREGTAVQMSAALADQLSFFFRLNKAERALLLRASVAAGFAAVFGTPLAGCVFALEWTHRGKPHYEGIIFLLSAAFLGDYCCQMYGIGHTHYHITEMVAVDGKTLLWAVVAGLAFGGTAWLYIQAHRTIDFWAKKHIVQPAFRPFWGGFFLLIIVAWLGDTTYIGLGIPTLQAAFTTVLPPTAFAWKLILTALTLGVGFKGGEVTPLFFIGAALGNLLACWLPLPISLLAAMGFVAVFAAASNTPMACLLMGLELFEGKGLVFIAVAVWVAYAVKGTKSIYTAQIEAT